MTRVEVAATLSSICALWIAVYFPEKALYRWGGVILVVSVLLLHIYYDAIHLGMIGTYIAAGMALVLLSAGSVWSPRQVPFCFYSGFFAALATICYLIVLPPLLRPSATGAYLVGRTQPHFTGFEPPEAAYRAPVVDLWYPVDPKASWIPSLYTRHFMREGLSDAPIANAEATFPLIIYFSGGSGTIMDGTNIVRELVSHGFIVASLHYPPVLQGLDNEASKKREADFGQDLFQFSVAEDFQTSMKPLDKRLAERASDARLLLDQIRSKATAPTIVQIQAHLAPNVAGVMGFSFGGSIAAEAKVLDNRFTAALNLDGWHFGTSVAGVSWPYLLVLSQEATDFYDAVKKGPQPPASHDAKLTIRDFVVTIPSLRRHGGYLLSIAGINHYNLADGAFNGSLFRDSSGIGTLDKYRAYGIVARVLVAYFNAHLKGHALLLPDKFQHAYPEATLDVWRPSGRSQR